MGRNRPKEGKIVDKMHFFLQTPTNLISPSSKTTRNGYYLSLTYDLVHRVTSGSGATSKTILTLRHAYEKARFARARTSMRAPSNSDVVFLLSQVSHQFLFSPDFRGIFSTHSSHNLHTSKRLFEELRLSNC